MTREAVYRVLFAAYTAAAVGLAALILVDVARVAFG